MSDMPSPCAPLINCDGLDGRVRVRRVIYGPVLVRELRPISFGEFSVEGGAIRPYIEVIFETRWVPKGLCRGLVASLMSLAPTESITAGLRVERRQSFSNLMREASESSFGSTVSIHNLTESTSQMQTGGGTSGGGGGSGDGILGFLEKAGSVFVDLLPVAVLAFGSWYDGPLDFAGEVLEKAGDVVGKTVDFLEGTAGNLFGGGGSGGGAGGAGPILTDTQHQLDEITNTIEFHESQSHLNQVVISESIDAEEFVRRTFSNPYRDRSLQLRFMPIFRHFEVVSTLKIVVHGLALVTGNIDRRVSQARPLSGTLAQAVGRGGGFAENPAAGTRAALALLQANGDYVALQRPMVELLTGRGNTTDRKKQARIERGLQWRATDVRWNAVHVPLADAQTLAKAWNLDKGVASRLEVSLSRFDPMQLSKLSTVVRQVNLFAGTHVEAVPGDCKLPDIITDPLTVTGDDGGEE